LTRILLVTDHYPPFIGGAHRQSYVLSHQLHERGYDVAVATIWHGGLPRYENDGVDVYRMRQIEMLPPWTARNKKQRHHPPFPDPSVVWQMRRLIDRFKPDIVHSHGWITYSAAVALIGHKTPLLITARDYGYNCATRTLLYHDQTCSGPAFAKCMECAAGFYGRGKGYLSVIGVFSGRPLLRSRVNGIHSISTFVQKVTESALGDDIVPDIVIPSFLAADEALELSEKHLSQLPKTPFILFVGALQTRKGLIQLLEAYQRLSAPPPLVLIGTIERDTPSDFPAGVTVLQSFPHGSVMDAWSRCLFGVVPSLWPEPLGAVVFEAMSRGKAVIGTTPGGHTDMISDGKTGLLVSPGNVDELTAAMQRLIDEPTLREQMGRAGKERIRTFTVDAVLPRFEALYRELLGGDGAVIQTAARSTSSD